MATTQAHSRDKRLLLWLSGVVLLIVVVVSVLAPMAAENDPRPRIENAGPAGAKAAFLTLGAMGWAVQGWDHPLEDLAGVDAARTTLVLAEPIVAAPAHDQQREAVRRFLERGGRVLVTGAEGATLLPGGETGMARRFGSLCDTQPEGPGPLAQAGRVEMQDAGRWTGNDPRAFVEQRCGPDAVVVRLQVGAGTAVWWSSAAPMTNAEVGTEADLHLLLASLGAGRAVLFDEALHEKTPSPWTATGGLPLGALAGQAALIFALLVFSFSRRHGPVRLPVELPRSSPLEFARSMGDLYAKVGATGAATEAAKRRLLRTLERAGGLSRQTVQAGPDAIAAELQGRFGGDWRDLREHLRQAADAADAHLKPRAALALVRALGLDGRRVRGAAAATSGVVKQRENEADAESVLKRDRTREGVALP